MVAHSELNLSVSFVGMRGSSKEEAGRPFMLGDIWEEAKSKTAGCSNEACRGHKEHRKQRGKRKDHYS